MTRELVTATGASSMVDVARIISERGVGSVIVVDDGRVVGLITERDVTACVAEGLELGSLRAAERDVEDVIYAKPDQSLEEAAALMVSSNVRHLPVVEGDELVGIISMRDLTRWSLNELNADVGELPHIELAHRVLSLAHHPG